MQPTVAYTLHLTPAEVSALEWVGERYEWTRALRDNLDEDSGRISLTEADAWEWEAAVNYDDFPFPCAGGEFKRKLERLLATIV